VPPTPKTPEQLLSEGWDAFTLKNYSLALTDFTAAIQGNTNLVDAYNGSGWTNAKLNALAASVTSFTDGLSKDTTRIAIKAGLAFVYNAQKQYQLSIDRALAVFQADPNWVFSHDLSISVSTLHILLAEDYFALANFTASYLQVQVVNPSFVADVSTRTGQSALAAEIERLRSLM
jgi:tetratricopeptide (TPR) repeat protein